MRTICLNTKSLQKISGDLKKGILAVRAEVAISLINPSCEEILKYNSEELIGKNDMKLSNPEEEIIENISTLQKKKKALESYSKQLEDKVQHRTHELMATIQKLVQTNLNLEEQLLITDIAKKEALTSKILTSKIAKYFPRGLILVIDKNLNVQFVEGEALDKLRIREKIYEGLDIHHIDLFSKYRKILIKENILKTLSGQHLSFEIKYKKYYFSVNTTPLYGDNGEVISALHVYNDISDQKNMEFGFQNALIKEKELNDLKSRFISMASHEFRTPLSAILTSAILIGKQNTESTGHTSEKYVEQIERNVNHLTVILNDFLSLSKIEEGEVEAFPQLFDIIAFCEDLLKETTIGLKKKQTIKMSTTIETLIVNLDSKLLRHLLLNLLTNAAKYSSEGLVIDLNIFQKNDNVMIEVIDTGIGIPEEEQKFLFQRFFRAKNASDIEGTGLGLNIAKNYAQLMNGNIGMNSQLNKGSTFWVELPINIS